MLPFNSWGNPYESDDSWRQLEVGNVVKVKGDVPITGYRKGRLKNKEDATWTVQFIDEAGHCIPAPLGVG